MGVLSCGYCFKGGEYARCWLGVAKRHSHTPGDGVGLAVGQA